MSLYCSGCGTESSEESAYCARCGKSLGTQPPAWQAGAPRRASSFAVASLVLGILSFIAPVIFIPQILAITFGSVALNQIRQDTGLYGRGMAIAGLACGASCLVLFILVTIFLGLVSCNGPY